MKQLEVTEDNIHLLETDRAVLLWLGDGWKTCVLSEVRSDELVLVYFQGWLREISPAPITIKIADMHKYGMIYLGPDHTVGGKELPDLCTRPSLHTRLYQSR